MLTNRLLTNRFHVTQNACCAILFDKDTFYTNVDVKSIYLHDTGRDLPAQVMEGEQGWVLQGVLSRAIFRRPPVSGQKYCTVLSMHISSFFAKEKGIAKNLILSLRAIMISQEVDFVAGIAAKSTSVLLTKHLWTVSCLRHRAPHHCSDLDPFRTNWQTSADFSNHLALNVLESE